jgi:hypothetical protein
MLAFVDEGEGYRTGLRSLQLISSAEKVSLKAS